MLRIIVTGNFKYLKDRTNMHLLTTIKVLIKMLLFMIAEKLMVVGRREIYKKQTLSANKCNLT